MCTVKYTSAFQKSYKLLKKRGLDLALLHAVIGVLRQGNRLDDKYRDHSLSGNYAGFRECYIRLDWLLIYKIENGILVLTMVNTGTHADLFNE